MRRAIEHSDWRLTDEMRAWAAVHYPMVNVDKEAPKFVDHWLGLGTPMANWDACFRTWVTRAERFGGSLYSADEIRLQKLMSEYALKGFRRAYTHESSAMYQAAFEAQALAQLPERDMSNVLQLAGSKRL